MVGGRTSDVGLWGSGLGLGTLGFGGRAWDLGLWRSDVGGRISMITVSDPVWRNGFTYTVRLHLRDGHDGGVFTGETRAFLDIDLCPHLSVIGSLRPAGGRVAVCACRERMGVDSAAAVAADLAVIKLSISIGTMDRSN